MDPLPLWIAPSEAVPVEESDDGRYPLFLMTPTTKNRIHSQFGNLQMIRVHDPVPLLDISPADA